MIDDELENIKEEDVAYINNKCSDIIAKIPELDESINEATTGWKTTRMGKVDLSIIRLAVYEIKFEESVPAKVAINEAVEYFKFIFLLLKIENTLAASVEQITDPISKLSQKSISKRKWQNIPTNSAVKIVPNDERIIALAATGLALLHFVPTPP